MGAVVLTACGGDGATGSSPEVEVLAGDDSCVLDRTDLEAGEVTFAVTNEGSKVTEVYVYGDSDGEFTKVVSEVENIGPGTSRDMVVDLGAGTYEIACKPGQTGDGIREPVTVTGSGGGESADEEGYDRELELTVDGTALTGLDPATAEKGERIEFKLENATDSTRTFEVLDPSGEEVARVRRAGRRGRGGDRGARPERRLDAEGRGRTVGDRADPHRRLTRGPGVTASIPLSDAC